MSWFRPNKGKEIARFRNWRDEWASDVAELRATRTAKETQVSREKLANTKRSTINLSVTMVKLSDDE